MSRFPSFNYAPGETRRILRDRFDRNLHVGRQARFLHPDAKVTPDQLALRLLAGLEVSSNANWQVAANAYAAAGPTEIEPRDLQALADLGWLRRIWGRARIGLDLRVAVLRAPAGLMDAFKVLLSSIHGQRSEANAAVLADAELADLLKTIEAGCNDSVSIASQTPAWVAARLWEIALAQGAPTDVALRKWVDWQCMLQSPLFVPATVWSAPDAQAFRDAAMKIIAMEPGLGGWDETRGRYVQRAALTNNVAIAIVEPWFAPAPDTLVDRALWMESRPVEGSAHDLLDICEDLFGVARLLLADADAEDNSPAPHPLAAQVIDLAIDRAELFIDLLFEVRARPRLFADLVIHPPSAALACLLIAQWRSPAGAWDRGLVERDDKIFQAEAFTDATAILGEHLRADRTSASEAAALLNWLHRRADRGFINDVAGADLVMAAFRRELANCNSSILLAMVQSLDGPSLRQGVGTPEFAAVLDLSDLGGIEDQVDAGVVVDAYACSIAMGDYSLSAHRIGIAGASALAQVAGRTPALRSHFLYPLDVRARLAAATPEDNEFILADSIGRALRAHIRVLCRAVIGGSTDAPADLLDALVAAVRTGAQQHKEKGRIAAFAPRFENQIGAPALDRPLAADLAGALASLDQARQRVLLAAILETDEPLILAQLLSRASPDLRLDIERRIAALAPGDAGAIQSLPEMQARIDELLTAGAAEAAASYMAAEAGLQTLGRTGGREIARFQHQLRLEFLRGDWAAIAATQEPSFPNPQEQAAAMEALRQFRGLAALKGPNPNPEMAKAIFAGLFAQRASLGFAVNWFAAVISELLPTDSFGLLEGDQIRKGRQAIAEVERMTTLLPAASGDETLACNQALLRLALGEPGQALAVLSAVTLVRLQDTAAAYRALALSRLGRRVEATAALDAAEHSFGRTAVLAAARTHIASGAPFLTYPMFRYTTTWLKTSRQRSPGFVR